MVSPGDLGLLEEVPAEVGSSHEENARLKAEAWSSTASLPAIATDGGLVIPALGPSWDSLLTHRFAGEVAADQTRIQRFLELIRPFHGEEREASWVEALAIAESGRSVGSWKVNGATGLIAEESSGGPLAPGFWVFSLWHFPEQGKTYNELDESELESLNDHWIQLRSLVQAYYRGTEVQQKHCEEA